MNLNNGNVNNNTRSNVNTNNRVRAFLALKVNKPLFYERYLGMKDLVVKENWIPLEDFFSAYKDCRRRKRTTMNALKFEVNYEDNLVQLWKDVNQRKYKVGKSITFIVTRPKLREIFAADFRDRVIHHVIMQRLEPLFENILIEDTYSCRKEKGTLYGVQRLRDKIKEISNNYTEDCWIGKFDIKGFFMSINKPILWNKLKTFIETNYQEHDKDTLLYIVEKTVLNRPQDNCVRKSPELMWSGLPANKSLFTCHEDCGIPIGNLTSQCFANFYLDEFDHILSNMFNGYYGRYVDDFYVLAKSKKEITRRVKFIRTWLWKNLRLTLHPDKTYIQHYSKGVRFIGSVVKKDRVRVGNVMLGNFYSAIHRFNVLDNTRENAIDLVHTANSYLGLMIHQDSFKRRKKLVDMLDRKWRGIVYTDKNYSKLILSKEYNPSSKIKIDLRKNRKETIKKIFSDNTKTLKDVDISDISEELFWMEFLR